MVMESRIPQRHKIIPSKIMLLSAKRVRQLRTYFQAQLGILSSLLLLKHDLRKILTSQILLQWPHLVLEGLIKK